MCVFDLFLGGVVMFDGVVIKLWVVEFVVVCGMMVNVVFGMIVEVVLEGVVVVCGSGVLCVI